MAEIRNYTLNFGYGRPAALTFATLTLAYAEMALQLGCALTFSVEGER